MAREVLSATPVRAPWRDFLLLVAVLLPALFLPWASLPVDVENTAMKSRGTPEAEDLARRRREFGDQHVVLLLFEPRATSAPISSPDQAAVQRLPAILRSVAGVVRVKPIPRPRRDAFLLAVEVAGDQGDGGYAGAVAMVQRTASAACPPEWRLAVGGQPVGEIAIAEAVTAEQRRMVPLVAAALYALLLLRYRSLGLAAAVLAPALVGIGLVAALQVALGQRVDPVAALLHPVLLTVGVASAVHVAERFRHLVADGRDVASAGRTAARELVAPTILTAGTTVAGFLALCPNAIPAVARFGALASLGALLTYALPFLVTPLVLRRCFGARAVARLRGSPPLGGALAPRLAGTLARAAPVLVPIALGLVVAGLLAWRQLGVETDPVRILPADHPFRVATARLSELLGGTETVDLYLPPRTPPASALQLSMLQLDLLHAPGVRTALGPARQSDTGSSLLEFLLAPGTRGEREALWADCTGRAAQAGFPGARVTGTHVQIARDSERLVRGQQAGIAGMLAVLFLFMAIGLRSAGLGLLGLLPNVLPCALLYGGMALFGRDLTVASAMIGSVMLGLVVDNTIHLLHHYLRQRRSGATRRQSVDHALTAAGTAILTTCLVLALGFAVAITGRLATTREFGLLTALAILCALAANLLILPAFLLLRRDAAGGPPTLPAPCPPNATT